MKTDDGRLFFSAQSGENMDVLMEVVRKEMRRIFREKALEEEPEVV